MSDAEIVPLQAGMPIDPDGETVGRAISALYQEPDAVTRWRAVEALTARRLNDVRAVSVRQLRAEGMKPTDIAETLGVTRQRVHQLLGTGERGADYTWGQMLGLAETLADLAGSRNPDEATKLVALGLAVTTIRPRLEEAVRRWAKVTSRAPSKRDRAAELLGRWDELSALAADVPASLTIDQRMQVALGYHGERRALAENDR